MGLAWAGDSTCAFRVQLLAKLSTARDEQGVSLIESLVKRWGSAQAFPLSPPWPTQPRGKLQGAGGCGTQSENH